MEKKYIKQAKREKISGSGGKKGRVEGWVLVEGYGRGEGGSGCTGSPEQGRAQPSGGNLRCFGAGRLRI